MFRVSDLDFYQILNILSEHGGSSKCRITAVQFANRKPRHFRLDRRGDCMNCDSGLIGDRSAPTGLGFVVGFVSQGFTLGYSRSLPPGGSLASERWKARKKATVFNKCIHAIALPVRNFCRMPPPSARMEESMPEIARTFEPPFTDVPGANLGQCAGNIEIGRAHV